jgi:UDP-glucose 4-epimerase
MRPIAVVLGAAGFIGRHVCREFHRNGYRVHGVGHGSWSEEARLDWGVSHWTEGDIDRRSLTEAAAGFQPQVLIHCAGSGSVSLSYSAPLEDYQRTVHSTTEMLEYARLAANTPRIVLSSSAAVYGDQGDVDVTENATRSPISPYGFNKVAAENACDSYSRFFGVQTSVVRLFSVYGEGLRKQLLWDAMNKLRRNEYSFFGTGHELRDWVHVEDAARLLFIAGTAAQAPYEVYNGANSHATTLDVLGQLSRAAGSPLAPRFTGETHVGNPRRLTANCGHARRQLGWLPAIGLTEGLKRYAAWFLQEVPG